LFERKIHYLLYSKCLVHIIGEDQTLKKGEKINDDTQTMVCVNLNSKQHCKIRGYGFGIFALTPMTRFIFLLAKLGSFCVHLPCSLISSGSPLSFLLPLGHHVLVCLYCATIVSNTACHCVLVHH
jgi:hypothetical protein